jgi:hypothetical protein
VKASGEAAARSQTRVNDKLVEDSWVCPDSSPFRTAGEHVFPALRRERDGQETP